MTLTARDRAVLRAVNRFRLCSTRHLVAVAFPGVRADTAAKRLRRLVDGRFITAHSSAPSAPNLYAAGPEGRRVLRQSGIEPGRIPRGNLEHHLDIVSAWIDLAQVVATVPGWTLHRFAPLWELEQSPIQGAPLPDALVSLHAGGDTVARTIALELDRGSESIVRLREKFSRYALSSNLDLVLAVVTVGAGERRSAAVRDALASDWPGVSLLWDQRQGSHDALQQLAALPLPTPLAPSPHSKGSAVVVSGENKCASLEAHPSSSAERNT